MSDERQTREVMMSLQSRWIVTIPLLLVLLTQSSCCTLLGYTIGSIIDGEPSPRESAELRRAARQEPDVATEVRTKDGRLVVGARDTSREPTRAELRELYRGLADHSSGMPRLPLPGDSILVSTATTRGWGLFDGFAGPKARLGTDLLDTTRAVSAVFAVSEGVAPLTVPWTSIRQVQWADSSRLEDPQRLLPTLARIPATPRIFTILTGSGGREEFRSWEVERIETMRARPATTIGLFTGLGGDFVLVYLVLQGLSGLGDMGK